MKKDEYADWSTKQNRLESAILKKYFTDNKVKVLKTRKEKLDDEISKALDDEEKHHEYNRRHIRKIISGEY